MGARVADLEDLQGQWRADHGLAAALNQAFDTIGFTSAYVDKTDLAVTGGKRKYIKDSVWGMIEFGGPEMRLIDSPLLQRLRGIRQLGFSYLTYPSAEHSRFIHSLGIGHVVSRFIDTIERNSNEAPPQFSEGIGPFRSFEALAPLTAQELRYAALLHDTGHMPFSHASEFALASRPHSFRLGGKPIEDHLDLAKSVTGNGKIKLAEVISLMIVLSARFEDFYKKIEPHASASSLPRIACLIAGLQPVDNGPNVQDIISSAAVDSDKIDYVARDAKACGISVGVDVSRIFLGGGLLQAARSAYDDAYEGGAQIDNIFVVNSSGADTLDEIVQARGALYQRVYLHPVTRTAEALLARALHLNAASMATGGEPSLADAMLLWSTQDGLLLDRLTKSEIAEVRALGERIRNRSLPKKACALAPRLTETQVPFKSQFTAMDWEAEARLAKHISNPFMEQLRSDNIRTLDPSALEDKIRDEALRLAALLKSAGRDLPGEELSLVVITPVAAISPDQPSAWVFQNGEITQTAAFTNAQGQADASDIYKAVGFIFCDEPWREVVLQAARRVIYQESLRLQPELIQQRLDPLDENSSVRFQRQTILNQTAVVRRSNLNAEDAGRILRWAGSAGYFDDAPLLAPRTSFSDSKVQTVASRFETFDGENGWRVKPRTIAAFTDQFPPRLREPLLNTLAQGRLLGQRDLTRLVADAVRDMREVSAGAVVMLPLSPSSGGSVHAAIKRGVGSDILHANNVSEALAVPNDPIVVFVDDNAASGVQSAAQLYAFAGEPPAKWPDELRRETNIYPALPADQWEELKHRRLAIVVAAGAKPAVTRLGQVAKDIKLERFLGLFYGTEIGGGLVWPEDLEEHLRLIGRDLIAQHEFRRPFAELSDRNEVGFCESRAFGYGVGREVLATWVNVPSSTVTALWQPGRFQGRPWVPLLLRRGRFSELVLG